MVVDTSAILAIVLDEPESAPFSALLIGRSRSVISAATLVELAAVGTRRFGSSYDDRIDFTLATIKPVIQPLTLSQATIAREAYRRYGLGTKHKAGLNMGDCFSYALAKERDEPLLFKGDDFVHTDVTPAIPR